MRGFQADPVFVVLGLSEELEVVLLGSIPPNGPATGCSATLRPDPSLANPIGIGADMTEASDGGF